MTDNASATFRLGAQAIAGAPGAAPVGAAAVAHGNAPLGGGTTPVGNASVGSLPAGHVSGSGGSSSGGGGAGAGNPQGGTITIDLSRALAFLQPANQRRLLATGADIDHVVASLAIAGQPTRIQVIALAQIALGQTFITFNGLPTGFATLTITAYAASGLAIGTGGTTANILLGQSNFITVNVPIDPGVLIDPAGTGAIGIGITFSDCAPSASSAPFPGSPPPFNGPTTALSGNVYDDAGALVSGAFITVVSLDASKPYLQTATTSQGSWVVSNVPQQANIQLTASRPDWTSRTRVTSFFDGPNRVDFGGPGSATDTAAGGYFISKYPEIVSINPGYDTTNVDNQSVYYQLAFSESFDSTNQNRIANALRLLPANAAATPDNDDTLSPPDAPVPGDPFAQTPAQQALGGLLYAFDLNNQRIGNGTGLGGTSLFSIARPASVDSDGSNWGYSAVNASGRNHPVSGGLTAPGLMNTSDAGTTGTHATVGVLNVPWDYSIRNGTEFLSDTRTVAQVTWDATGTVASFTFNAPLIASRVDAARYQVALISGLADERIVDKHNNQLGLDDAGSQSATPQTGELLHAVLQQPDLTLHLPAGVTAASATSAQRWLFTHQDAARFAVNIASRSPALQSVGYSKTVNNRSSRFEFTFDEPLGAYNGRPGGHVGYGIANGSLLQTLSFAVSNRSGGTFNTLLQGGTPGYFLDPGRGQALPANLFGALGADLEREFFLARATAAGETTMGRAFGALDTADLASPLANPAGVVFPYGTAIQDAEGAGPQASDGSYLLELNPSVPRTLFVYIVGRPSVFDLSIVELKARASGVPDLAGNVIQDNEADNNPATTSLQAS